MLESSASTLAPSPSTSAGWKTGASFSIGRFLPQRRSPIRQGIARLLESVGPLDLVAGPSGYGLPLVAARNLTEDDVRLACLLPPGSREELAGSRT